MRRLSRTRWSSHLGAATLAVALAIGAWTAAPTSAAARVFVGIGVPFPGYYAPYPYYYPPAYYPYYPPPPAYYPPPAPAYYPQPPAAGAPAALGVPGTGTPGAPQAGAAITYTNRPAFKNAAGQTCREYQANGALGTACQDASGQWRIAN